MRRLRYEPPSIVAPCEAAAMPTPAEDNVLLGEFHGTENGVPWRTVHVERPSRVHVWIGYVRIDDVGWMQCGHDHRHSDRARVCVRRLARSIGAPA